MKEEKNNSSVKSYVLALKSMSLASGMMVLGAVCDSIKKEWPECKKIEKAYSKFDKSIEKACHKHRGLTPAVVNFGKAFLDELNSFQKLEDAQEQNLQKLIKRVKKNVLKIINPRD